MLKHHILLTYRNILRYKSSFFINLVGLSSGLACALLIYLWVNDELGVDTFHQKETTLFQVMEHQKYAVGIMTTQSTPGLLAETLKEEIPEIEYAATTTWINAYTLTVDDVNTEAEGFHVGSDYFNIFSYNLYEGDPNTALKDNSSIVISRDLAGQLFGTDDAIGQEVQLQHDRSFLVTGVFEGTPGNSSVQFDFVLSFELYKETNPWVTNWQSNGPRTYIILRSDANPKMVSDKIADFVRPRNEDTNVTLFLEPYSHRYLYGSWENGQPDGGRIEYVRLFSIIAIFILVIACINFMNLSTARASRRAMEVGMKKAVGASRASLIGQYLVESMIITGISLIVAFMAIWLFIPKFNSITSKEIELVVTPSLTAVAMGITILTGLIAGSYPALYLSGFQPAAVLKKEIHRSGGELWIRQGLVVFQFTLSIVLIVAVTIIYSQISFMQTKNLGYKNDNLIQYEIEGAVEDRLDTYLTEIQRIPGVVIASSIGHSMLGQNNNTSGLKWEGKNPDDRILFENVRVNYNLIETMDMEILEGRSFQRELNDDTVRVIFNEAGIEVMGMQDPIGQVIRLWDEYDLEIIGVVKNFHFQSLHTEVKPLFIWVSQEYNWNIMVRIEGGKEKETLAALESQYSSFNPGFTFDYKFMDVEYQNMYRAEQQVASLSKYFAIFAILISCLGLFGLAAFTAERRMKEIGIRKALGSTVANIVYLLTKDFTRLVFISILIGVPLSFMLVYKWLQGFAYSMELNPWYFVGAGVVAIVVAWMTVGIQAFKSANVNPITCLREQ